MLVLSKQESIIIFCTFIVTYIVVKYPIMINRLRITMQWYHSLLRWHHV